VASVEQNVENLDRLKRQLRDLKAGETSARDDVAVILQILVGDGGGYGIFHDLCEAESLGEPTVRGWLNDIPASFPAPGHFPASMNFDQEISDYHGDVVLGIRPYPAPHLSDTFVPLSDYLQQSCLRFEHPNAPATNWSYVDVIKKVRNKFGSHVDPRPPQWLRELRYYPAADRDVVSLLMWSIGTTVHAAARNHIDMLMGGPATSAVPDYTIGAIDLSLAYVTSEGEDGWGQVSVLRARRPTPGVPIPIIGAVTHNRSLIFGLTGEGVFTVLEGEDGIGLDEALNRFRVQPGVMNRDQRRAAARGRRR
jgi:hypothetical protein